MFYFVYFIFMVFKGCFSIVEFEEVTSLFVLKVNKKYSILFLLIFENIEEQPSKSFTLCSLVIKFFFCTCLHLLLSDAKTKHVVYRSFVSLFERTCSFGRLMSDWMNLRVVEIAYFRGQVERTGVRRHHHSTSSPVDKPPPCDTRYRNVHQIDHSYKYVKTIPQNSHTFN